MARFQNLAKKLALVDGRIDEREARIIREEFLGDHKVDRAELEFLLEVRREAKEVVPAFTTFVHQVIKKVILTDGVVGESEAAWLKKWIVADRKLDSAEKQLLQELKAEAKGVSKAFQELYDACMKA